MASDMQGRGRAWALVGLFVLIVGLVALDVAEDLRDGAPASHVVGEVVVMGAALAGATLLGLRLRSSREQVHVLRERLDAARADAQRWRDEASTLLEGLGAAIQRQFDRWELTPAEAEIGLLLLKGLSFKEIAQVRGASERTVRQQALAIYRKSGLAGRAELSAFFLEDLLFPE